MVGDIYELCIGILLLSTDRDSPAPANAVSMGYIDNEHSI